MLSSLFIKKRILRIDVVGAVSFREHRKDQIETIPLSGFSDQASHGLVFLAVVVVEIVEIASSFESRVATFILTSGVISFI